MEAESGGHLPSGSMRLTLGVLWLLIVPATSALDRLAGPDLQPSQPARYTIKGWHTDDGLPQSTPREILQTRDGYLWIGTFHGLARFDGLHFRPFTISNTRNLRSDTIVTLFEDRAGDLWIGTEHGLVRNRHGQFTSFEMKDGLPAEEVKGLAEDGAGQLWVAMSGRLLRRTGDRFEELPISRGGGPTNIEAMKSRRKGQVWIGTKNGLWELKENKLRLVSAHPRLNIRRLAVDESGRLWIAPWTGGLAVWENETLNWVSAFEGVLCSNMASTRQGDIWFGSMVGDLLKWDGQKLQRFGADDGLGGYRATAVAEDHTGNIWVGRGASGLYRMRPIDLLTLTKADGLTSEDLTCVAEDDKGAILLGSFGGGLVKVQNGKCTPMTLGGESSKLVTSILNAGDDGLWIGKFDERPVRWQDGQAFPGPMKLSGTRAFFRDREGAFWIGSNSDGLERVTDGKVEHFTAKNGLSSDQVLCIEQDPEGAVWVGTERGLNRISGGRIECFFMRDGLSADHVRALCPDRKGTVFVGTVGGLSAWRRNRWRTFTTRDGLLNDMVSEMVEDGMGNLWLGTQAGLMRLSLNRLEEFFDGQTDDVLGQTFGREDGLASIEISSGYQPSCLRARDGRLWFCTGAGAVIVDPKRVRETNEPPVVHVEAVLANGQVISDAQTVENQGAQPAQLVIPSRSDRVEIRYTGINLAAPNALKFRRQLVGYETDWVDVGNQREAFYTKLPPGKYQFRVIARNNDSAWNESGARIALTVLPAWWQTLWFRALLVGIVLGTAFGFYFWRVNQLERRQLQQELFSRRLLESQETERKRIAAELHDSLGQNLLVIKNRAQMARQPGATVESELNEITRLAAQSLEEVRDISQNLRPYQLDRLGLTRALQSVVRKVNASSKVNITANIMPVDRLFPSEAETNVFRILQEALNNILKHSAATEAHVEVEQNDSQVQLMVEDNGRGFVWPLKESERTHGMGLSGIAERVRILRGRLEINSAPGRGTRLKITVPIPKGGK